MTFDSPQKAILYKSFPAAYLGKPGADLIIAPADGMLRKNENKSQGLS
jgi:hypothetical protein